MQRQAPGYIIVGNGKMAKHICHYFSLLSIAFVTWNRQKNTVSELKQLSQIYSYCLLAIKDDAIEMFISTLPFLQNNTLIHFSGTLDTPLATGLHPLFTFTDRLYTLAEYQSICFVSQSDPRKFKAIFPNLPNQVYKMRHNSQALYHALCVMSGNFTTILWQKCFADFEEKLGLPKHVLHPYLQQIMNNLISDNKCNLTGPLARGDVGTIKSNLSALDNDPFQQIYRAFLYAHQKIE